jgi:hypothetical protein
MSTIVEKLAAAGHLTPEQVEKIGEAVSEFLKEASSDPELLKEAHEKLAIEWGPIARRLASKAGLGAAATAGGLGVLGLYNIAHSKIKQLKDDIGKAKHYKAMLENNPELSDSNVDAKVIQNHFNTLYKFNPDYAKDPMVAGAYVEQSMDAARPNLAVLNQMVGAREQHIKSEAFSRETPATRQFIGMIGKGVGALGEGADKE